MKRDNFIMRRSLMKKVESKQNIINDHAINMI